jgi:hypothetical protein
VSEDFAMDSRMARLDSIGGIMEEKNDNMMSRSSSPMGAFISAFHDPFPVFRNYSKKFSKLSSGLIRSV